MVLQAEGWPQPLAKGSLQGNEGKHFFLVAKVILKMGWSRLTGGPTVLTTQRLGLSQDTNGPTGCLVNAGLALSAAPCVQ